MEKEILKINPEDSKLIRQLKEYLNNTPQEELDKFWDSTEYLNKIGPTVEEYFSNLSDAESINLINKMKNND
jgi:hypothetical protein